MAIIQRINGPRSWASKCTSRYRLENTSRVVAMVQTATFAWSDAGKPIHRSKSLLVLDTAAGRPLSDIDALIGPEHERPVSDDHLNTSIQRAKLEVQSHEQQYAGFNALQFRGGSP